MTGSSTILVCDDEELIRWSLAEHLRKDGHRVSEAEDGLQCLESITREAPDLVITDLKMPGLDGMEVLQRLREQGNDVPVIVITAHGDVGSAIEATRLGAKAYLSKPFDLREVGLAVTKVLQTHRLESEVRYLRSQQSKGYGRLIGDSPAMQRLFHTLRRLERIDAPTVLIVGESGTGKDLIARAIHEAGPRHEGPLMEVDCASLPEQLIESELFGHEKGSFTDARATKRGLFEVARGGTIFLDEIGEMSPNTQAKLLRALENRKFKRVGGVADIPLDAGVIAATNRDLSSEVKKGGFREDLFFRLNVIRIEVPPLRERREDISTLVEHFIRRFNTDFGRAITGVSAEAMFRLTSYPWPGNVRELRNVVERIVILEAEDVIRSENLPPEIRFARAEGGSGAASSKGAPFVLPEEGVNLDEVEKSLIQQAIDRTLGNQSAAARLLGVSRYTLRYRMEKYGLATPEG
ncbi:sigma-54 dependent transcriptional regulator [Myxococcota bacterium]|nr:sigma-54 dependent transcriptional regulator [Myxococcota bacterium]